jgi:uncharacterized membrane protein
MSRTRSTVKIEIKHELALVLGLAFILNLIIYVWPEPVLRVTLGLLYSFFFPGYVLVAALFPGRDDLDGAERVALGFGISMAVLPLIGLLLNYTPWGIRLAPILVAVTFFILLCVGVAYYRRGKLSADRRFVIRFELDLSRFWRVEHLDRFLSIALTLSIVFAIGAFFYAIARPKAKEELTEFYVLGPDSTTAEIPREAVVGEPIVVIVGIVNHEYGGVQYRVERVESGSTSQVATLLLDHEETREQPYAFTLTEPGEDRKVTFLLFKGDDEEPYRSLHLWITVKDKPPAQ